MLEWAATTARNRLDVQMPGYPGGLGAWAVRTTRLVMTGRRTQPGPACRTAIVSDGGAPVRGGPRWAGRWAVGDIGSWLIGTGSVEVNEMREVLGGGRGARRFMRAMDAEEMGGEVFGDCGLMGKGQDFVKIDVLPV